MKVPARNYVRELTVSEHALDRFRERVDEEFRHRDAHDLGNLLDHRVRHATQTYQVADPRAPGVPTQLCEILCNREATPFYAVTRQRTIVTLLDAQMARNNFAGQWGDTASEGTPVLNRPFAALGGLKIKPSPAKPAHAAADPIANVGADYARALQRQSASDRTLAMLRAELQRVQEDLVNAEEARRLTTQDVEDAHQRMLKLTKGTP